MRGPTGSLRSDPLQGGKPRAITAEGVVASVVSSDGSYVAGLDLQGKLAIYRVDGGESRSIPNLQAGLVPIAWNSGGSSLYVSRNFEVPARIYQVDIATGHQQLVRELMPLDPAGIVAIRFIQLSPDAKSYVYSYERALSELYVVEGLK